MDTIDDGGVEPRAGDDPRPLTQSAVDELTLELMHAAQRCDDDLVALLAITQAQAEMEQNAPWSLGEAYNIFGTLREDKHA